MVWGDFTAAGVGKLIRCEESINAKEYIKILERRLLPTVQQFIMTETMIFQQDNAQDPSAPMTKKWLAEISLELMFWPGQSPDLNPIENIWSIITRSLLGKTFSNKNKI